MDRLHIFLLNLLGAVSCSPVSVSGSVLEVTVRPGDNITLYCDCELSTGVRILWYRNCSHENQPPLVLSVKLILKMVNSDDGLLKNFPCFQFVKNFSSKSYDLLIMNITHSDEGLYYCGTEQTKVEAKEYKTIYRYGNITTRIVFNSSSECSGCVSDHVPVVPLMMVFSPALTILSSFIIFVFVYHFCQKTDNEPQILQKGPDTRGHARCDQDEDVFLTRVLFRAKDGQTHQ